MDMKINKIRLSFILICILCFSAEKIYALAPTSKVGLDTKYETIRRMLQSPEAKANKTIDIITAFIREVDAYHRKIYDAKTLTYSSKRTVVSKDDLESIFKSINLASSSVYPAMQPMEGKYLLLDVGTGLRDTLLFLSKDDIDFFGIDFSEQTVSFIIKHAGISSERMAVMDMKELKFNEETFHIIRANASLHHVPMFYKGVGADRAVNEVYRVLRSGGVYELSVKASENEPYFGKRDTGEELGVRYYQFYSKDSLRALLERNGFINIDIKSWIDERGEKMLTAWVRKPPVFQGRKDTLPQDIISIITTST